ncbi:MAG: molecular chaperone HtpG [Desulfuromonadales bacterium]|nr:molecular chaperone HtpG [Desulfuromonadales bacterium]
MAEKKAAEKNTTEKKSTKQESTEQKSTEQGTISIHTENIFPIIKKWLYSEKEIFLRELVSNAVDAIHKLQHVNLLEGLQIADEYRVDVSIDKDNKTLTIKDNGIGMTADEVRRYINQIAFSSAEEFVQKFKDLDDKSQIIGHFGLGFYSAFMVAKKVEIRSLSYQEGASGAHWSCDGSTSYELAEIEIDGRGTEITLYLDDDELEFLEATRVREVLTRYCNFLPIAIHLEGEVVNDQNPLWTRMATELSDDDYKEFYRKLYPFSEDPLFWIHLNIDFPFNLKGILYFPKLNNEFDVTKSHIKLFCNQVFVSDNCAELIPEFLTPLQGCLDAPDLPLNVSRSYLQNDPQVRKIRDVITSRVAGKLIELDKQDRKAFSAIWSDIHTFVKFGMMREDKFYEKLKDHMLFSLSGSDEWVTLPEYLENNSAAKATTVYYTNDEVAQSTYLKLFKAQGIDVLVFDTQIDSHFMQFLEMKNSEVKFARVDADVTENLIQQDASSELVDGEDGKTRDERIAELFKQYLQDEELELRVERLKDESVSAMALFSEQDRRFQEMTRTLGKEISIPDKGPSLLINANSSVVQNILDLHAKQKTEDVELLIAQVFDLAMLTCRAFDQEQMSRFLDRSNQLLARINAEAVDKN